MGDAIPHDHAAVSDRPALLSWLDGLDDLLRVAVVAVRDALSPTAVLDPYRGLHVTAEDVDRLLRCPPGGSPVPLAGPRPPAPAAAPAPAFPRLERLTATFALTPFDSAALLIALAPEIDLRYERLYGFLQDDVTLRRPTVDLALALLCPDPAARLAGRHRFSEAAPLRGYGLIHLVPARDRGTMPARTLEADPQVVRYLTADPGLDPRLVDWATLSTPAASDDCDLGVAVARVLAGRDGTAVELTGADPAAHRRVAAVAAGSLGRPLISADPTRAGLTGPGLAPALATLVREAWSHDALLHVALRGPEARPGRERLDEVLAACPGTAPACVVSLDGRSAAAALARNGTPRVVVAVGLPDAAERSRIWAACLDRAGGRHDVDVHSLGVRYRMSREQIEAAVAAARGEAAWHAARSRRRRLTTEDLAAAARVEIRVDLGPLATRVEAGRRWGDLVVPDDVRAQLREFCDRVTRRGEVLDRGGFADRLGPVAGVPMLFAGPSGSGKTMAAGIVAAELGLDCFRIDLSTVVSKYIGETEKNLERVFAAAEHGDLLLFFDECDALFGKRSAVHDAHDRYANIEISYLLQRLESYPGPVILATNLLHNLDEAFTRRLAFVVHFPMPGVPERRHIWERIWPAGTHVAADVDAGEMARRYALSGGHIRNMALAGAFLAAVDGGPVRRRHVLHAVRREYQKLGAEPPEAGDV